jgi:hypothetical protein
VAAGGEGEEDLVLLEPLKALVDILYTIKHELVQMGKHFQFNMNSHHVFPPNTNICLYLV